MSDTRSHASNGSLARARQEPRSTDAYRQQRHSTRYHFALPLTVNTAPHGHAISHGNPTSAANLSRAALLALDFYAGDLE